MPRAVSRKTKKPLLAKRKSHAHDLLLEMKEANERSVKKGVATKLSYRVVKLQKGYGIYYKKTGRWR